LDASAQRPISNVAERSQLMRAIRIRAIILTIAVDAFRRVW